MKKITLLVLLTQLVVCATDNALGQNANKTNSVDEITTVSCDDKDEDHCACYHKEDCNKDGTVGCGRYRTCTACDGGGKSDFDGLCSPSVTGSIGDIIPFTNALGITCWLLKLPPKMAEEYPTEI